ncbi:hypothetical protein F5884DRAFT_669300 [Xylogone sp. PMI_703]|nr:hypothetical protein F5884DRAFT_669300 [Xylogone sp. PMI_703]
MSSLAGKVAIVTGGSKGIGRATALRLANEGAKVVVNYSSSDAEAEEVVKQIGADNAISVKANAGDIKDIERLVSTTVEKFGKIDVVVASAAIMGLNEMANVDEAEWDRHYNLNVKGPFFLVQKAAPHMAPGSHVILFSTTLCAASNVTPNYVTYCSTKGAIEQMTRLLSKDLARKSISVNCVAPGPTATDLFLKGKPEGLIKTIASLNPQNRLGKPEEIADVVAYLSSSGSSWVTGQVLRVNGGMA